MKKIVDNLSSKKLLVFLFVSIAGTVVWYCSDESVFNDWKDFMVWTTGIYTMGNVGEHGAKAISKNNNNDNGN